MAEMSKLVAFSIGYAIQQQAMTCCNWCNMRAINGQQNKAKTTELDLHKLRENSHLRTVLEGRI